MDATSEEEFVSALENEFVKYGWDVDREVVADEGSDRTDVTVQHGGVGLLISRQSTSQTSQPEESQRQFAKSSSTVDSTLMGPPWIAGPLHHIWISRGMLESMVSLGPSIGASGVC
jgi:hypothetical protein